MATLARGWRDLAGGQLFAWFALFQEADVQTQKQKIYETRLTPA